VGSYNLATNNRSTLNHKIETATSTGGSFESETYFKDVTEKKLGYLNESHNGNLFPHIGNCNEKKNQNEFSQEKHSYLQLSIPKSDRKQTVERANLNDSPGISWKKKKAHSWRYIFKPRKAMPKIQQVHSFKRTKKINWSGTQPSR